MQISNLSAWFVFDKVESEEQMGESSTVILYSSGPRVAHKMHSGIVFSHFGSRLDP